MKQLRLVAATRSSAASFDASILTLILLNVAAFVLETVPEYGAAYASEFEAFNVFSVAVFTLEYVLRLWTAVEVPFLRHDPPWKARLKLAATPALIIDLLAILPFYVQALFGMDLRILRVLRLLRFLKLSRYSPALHTLMRVLSNERRSLLGAGLLLVTALLFASSGIYLIESHAQPDKFGSIPASAWWAIATLTTVGYGDIVPITPLGRIFGSFVMVTGLCILALPVAIISAGFSQETSRRDFVVNWSLMSRIPLLAELDAREVGELMPLLHAHHVPPKYEILQAGLPARAMFFVASGKVRMQHPEAEVVFEFGRFLWRNGNVDRRLTQCAVHHRNEVPAPETARRGLPPPRTGQPALRRRHSTPRCRPWYGVTLNGD